jgi:hypothetical protein
MQKMAMKQEKLKRQSPDGKITYVINLDMNLLNISFDSR